MTAKEKTADLFDAYNRARTAYNQNNTSENLIACQNAYEAARASFTVKPGYYRMKSGRITFNETRAWNSWIK